MDKIEALWAEKTRVFASEISQLRENHQAALDALREKHRQEEAELVASQRAAETELLDAQEVKQSPLAAARRTAQAAALENSNAHLDGLASELKQLDEQRGAECWQRFAKKRAPQTTAP